MPHLVAGNRKVGVRGILAPGLPLPPQVVAQLGVPQVEQRTDERQVPYVGDALQPGESVRACAAGHPQDERLRDVVGMVPRRDGVQLQPTRHPRKEVEPDAARGHFKGLAGAAHDARAGHVEGQAVRGRQSFYEARIVGGVGAQAMVDVQHERVEAQLLPQVREQQEERGRIGPAGNGEAEAPTRRGRRARGGIRHQRRRDVERRRGVPAATPSPRSVAARPMRRPSRVKSWVMTKYHVNLRGRRGVVLDQG